MKKALVLFSLILISIISFSQTTLIDDNFDSYTIGDYLGLSSELWTTWNNLPGTDEDAKISNNESYSSPNSVLIDNKSDSYLPLGNKTSGIYQLSFKYYLENGHSGYFSIQHFEVPGVEWALGVYLFGDGTANVDAGEANAASFSFATNTWVSVNINFDLDNDEAILQIDGTTIHTWPFHYKSLSKDGTTQLGAFNMFAWNSPTQTAKVYLDDVKFIEIDPGQPAQISIIPDSINVTSIQNTISTIPLKIKNTGGQYLNYKISFNYNFNTKNKTIPIIIDSKKINQKGAFIPTSEIGNLKYKEKSSYMSYAGQPFSGVGWPFTEDKDVRISAKFPHEVLKDYLGMKITSISTMIYQIPYNYKVQIYDIGPYSTNVPGDLIAEKDHEIISSGQQDTKLDEPITITGNDLWIGYKYTQPVDSFVAMYDGSTNPSLNGDYYSTNQSWHHLNDMSGLDGNWCIYAQVEGEKKEPYLAIKNTDINGSIAPGDSNIIDISIDSYVLEAGVHQATIIIASNDNENGYVEIPIVVNIFEGTGENDFISYEIPDVSSSVQIDIENHELKVYTQSDTALNSLIATFEVSDGATAYVNDVEQISGETANNYYISFTYTVVADDLQEQDWDCTLIKNTGVEEFGDKIVRIYPNPLQDELNISLDLKYSSNITINIYNITGELAYSEFIGRQNAGHNKFTYDVNNLKTGNYIVEIVSDKQIMTQKISIIK